MTSPHFFGRPSDGQLTCAVRTTDVLPARAVLINFHAEQWTEKPPTGCRTRQKNINLPHKDHRTVWTSNVKSINDTKEPLPHCSPLESQHNPVPTSEKNPTMRRDTGIQYLDATTDKPGIFEKCLSGLPIHHTPNTRRKCPELRCEVTNYFRSSLTLIDGVCEKRTICQLRQK